jgi:hypothetical protein
VTRSQLNGTLLPASGIDPRMHRQARLALSITTPSLEHAGQCQWPVHHGVDQVSARCPNATHGVYAFTAGRKTMCLEAYRRMSTAHPHGQ